MRYSLRPASPGDLAALWELHRRTMRAYVERTWGWRDGEQEEMFRAKFRPERLQVIVVEGVDVGVMAVERGADGYFLASIEIDPAFQGRGIGGEVVGDVVREAAAAGLATTLQVLKVNPARALYERLGFVVFGETATHVRMRAGP